MYDVNIRTNVKEIQKSLSQFAYKQMPKATGQAINSITSKVAAAQVKNMQQVLDRPTPFTLKSVGVSKAGEWNNFTGTIYIKDIAAVYLEPYEFGGLNKLNSRVLLKPVALKLNQYGNLPRTKLAQLKNRKDIFIGAIKSKKSGQQINGVWQRIAGARKKPAGLKLLIAFTGAHPVKQHLGWHALAKTIINKNLNRELGAALARAIAQANK